MDDVVTEAVVESSSPAVGEIAPENGSAVLLAGEPANDEPEQTRVTAVVKLCCICDEKEARYKCPRCALPYCSVACFRTHKESHPPDEQKPTRPTLQDRQKPQTAAPVNRHPFSILDDAPELQHLFRRYPYLPTQLSQIHAATLPPKDSLQSKSGLPWKMPDFPKKPGAAWSRDTGLREGRKALSKARMDPGEEGDAVREYCEIVLYLLAKSVSDTGNITSTVQNEVAESDVKLVEALMQAEGT